MIKYTIDCKGETGNAYYIISKVKEFLILTGRECDFDIVYKEMTKSDYNNLISTVEKRYPNNFKFINK